MDVLILASVFRLYPRLESLIVENFVRKNQFSSARFCWDSRLFSRGMDQRSIFGGTIADGDSYLELQFRHFKLFRLHAVLHDAAGAVKVRTWWQRSWLLLHDWMRTKFMFAWSRDWTFL